MRNKGMGLFSTVFVVLLILKLCGVAAISWWVVFAPILCALAIWVVILVVTLLIAIVFWLADDKKGRLR